MSIELKPRQDFLDTALACGATLTGKPDGSEAITVVFTIDAWRKFDSAIQQAKPDRTGLRYYKNDACKAESADSGDCICWTPQQAESDHARLPGILKDHQIADMVNSLRDIALQFHGHGSLRERIANVLVPALKAEAKTDVRCEGCGYMTHHREHMGCVRAAKQFTHPTTDEPEDVARDADRYRWLRRKACVIGKTTYCGEETGQPILDFVNLPDVTEVIRRDSASTLDAAIDAAMLAASSEQKS